MRRSICSRVPACQAARVARRSLLYLRPHRLRFLGGVGLTILGIGLDLVKPLPVVPLIETDDLPLFPFFHQRQRPHTNAPFFLRSV